MRATIRLVVALFILALAAGPAFAATLMSHASPTLAAPGAHPATPGRSILSLVATGVSVFGAIKVKDAAAAAKKFASRAQAASGDYKDGVANAGGDWEAGARAGADNYAAGVQEAIADGRFAKGVNGAGAKYTKNATQLGPQRYQQGVANAQDAYTQGVQPYLAKLSSIQLPPKGPRGSAQNQQRANMVAMELRKQKTGK